MGREKAKIFLPVFGCSKLFIWPLAAKTVQKLSAKLLAAFLFPSDFRVRIFLPLHYFCIASGVDAKKGPKANFVGTKSKIFNIKTRDNW